MGRMCCRSSVGETGSLGKMIMFRATVLRNKKKEARNCMVLFLTMEFVNKNKALFFSALCFKVGFKHGRAQLLLAMQKREQRGERKGINKQGVHQPCCVGVLEGSRSTWGQGQAVCWR